MRPAPVILALLLICAAVAAAAGAPGAGSPAATAAPSPVAATDATDGFDATDAAVANATNATAGNRVLSVPPDDVSNARVDAARIDVGVAVSMEVNASATRMETSALRNRITAADSNDERQRRILDGMNDIEKQLVTLRTDQASAITAFAAGEIDARRLYVRLARVQAEANALEDRLAVLGRLAEATEGNTVDSGRVQSLRFQLLTFDGPVRDRATAAIHGDAPPTRVYAAASDQGVVLTTVVDGAYVREAYRGDLQSFSGSTISGGVAENVTARSYPEIWTASDNPTGSGSGATFIVEVPHPGGRLTAFVDGESERVFKEYQHIPLRNASTGDTRTRTIDLTLRVNRTYAGGPLRVQVVDPDTGTPVNAAVRIAANGQGSVEVGTTGDDGVLWTVAPRGTFVVTAIDQDSEDLSTLELTSDDPLSVRETFPRNGSANES